MTARRSSTSTAPDSPSRGAPWPSQFEWTAERSQYLALPAEAGLMINMS